MDKLIKEMQEHGFINIVKFQLRGKADPVLKFWELMAKTEPIEQDRNWWSLRAWVIAHDKSKDYHDYSLESKLIMRRN